MGLWGYGAVGLRGCGAVGLWGCGADQLHEHAQAQADAAQVGHHRGATDLVRVRARVGARVRVRVMVRVRSNRAEEEVW